MQVAEALEQHSHVALDMLRLEDDALFHQDRLQIGLAELENEVEILMDEEYVHQLQHKYSKQSSKSGMVNHESLALARISGLKKSASSSSKHTDQGSFIGPLRRHRQGDASGACRRSIAKPT